MWCFLLSKALFAGIISVAYAGDPLGKEISGVSYHPSSHRLYYVPSVNDINYTAVGVASSDFTDVPAHVLENNRGVTVKAMAQGGTLVQLEVNGTKYLWDNIEGATYYGAGSNNFPFKRGLIVNGGVRFTAVAPEHGLYYDIDWDVSIHDSSEDEKSITLSIVDNEEMRERARTFMPEKGTRKPVLAGFSTGRFNQPGVNGEMTGYPTTDMIFSFKITLRKDEDFVRLHMSVENNSTDVKTGEAWLPLTFPVTEDSVILAKQQKRWRRDTWCLLDVTPSFFLWDYYPVLHKPLDWSSGCIFYDYPSMDGHFHGVTTNPEQGQGIVYYYSEDSAPRYTKLWSWGKFTEDNILSGRPASDYYEPWSGASSVAFFQPNEFAPRSVLSWELALLPISEGLTSQIAEELLGVVESQIDSRMHQLSDIQPVKVEGLDQDPAPTSQPASSPAPTRVLDALHASPDHADEPIGLVQAPSSTGMFLPSNIALVWSGFVLQLLLT